MKTVFIKIFVLFMPIATILFNVFIMWTLGTGGFGERINFTLPIFFPFLFGIVKTVLLLLTLVLCLRFFTRKINKTIVIVYYSLILVGLIGFTMWCTTMFSFAC